MNTKLIALAFALGLALEAKTKKVAPPPAKERAAMIAITGAEKETLTGRAQEGVLLELKAPSTAKFSPEDATTVECDVPMNSCYVSG